MKFFCQWTNPPVHDGESGFPPTIVDDRDSEPIASIVARMTRGQYVAQKSGYYDSDLGADPDQVPNVFDDVDADMIDRAEALERLANPVDVPVDTKPSDPPIDDAGDNSDNPPEDKPAS